MSDSSTNTDDTLGTLKPDVVYPELHHQIMRFESEERDAASRAINYEQSSSENVSVGLEEAKSR